MTIPRVKDFVAAVGQGPNLNKVTNTLIEYERLNQKPHTLDEEITALRALIAACKTWIKQKDAKSEYRKNKLGQKTGLHNTKFTGRRAHVAGLAQSATEVLMTGLAKHGLLTSDERGQLRFDINKYRQKALLTGSRHQVQGLADGYENERKTWEKSGKTFATSGSRIHQATAMRTKGWNSNQITALKNVTGNGHGTYKDWMVLGELDRTLGEFRVAYLKKSERYQFMAFVNNGLLVDCQDKPVHTDRLCLWAMDGYANMYVYDDGPVMDLKKINQVNHSSVNAGKAVICAGMIQVDKGVLKDMTNTSGHYKPSKQDLAHALEILDREGLDLSGAEVRTVNFAAPRQPGAWVMWQTYDPIQFVSSNGNCRPLKEELGPAP